MDEAALRSKVEDVFRETFDNDSIMLRDDMTARDIEGWDSVGNVRLMVALEQALNITFDMAEISELKNVGELIAAIQARRD
jgi:acyl carrier protein